MVLSVLLLSVIASSLKPVSATAVPIGDDYNYTAADPSPQRWERIQQQQHTDGTRHELWVADPYLYSENQSCQPGLDFDSTRAGCGMDATMDSVGTLSYVASSGQRMVLTERYGPSRRVAVLCWVWYPGNPLLNTHYPPDDYSMHWIGLRDSAQPGAAFVYIIIEHACIGGTDWKYGMKAYYTGTDGTSHYEAWTDYVVQENQWLDLTLEIGNNGNDVRLTAKNTSTGLSYFKTITTNLGSTNAAVEIAVQYRHNEFSKTDYVDARISDPDFSMSAGPVLNACADSLSWQRITLTSLNGFSGTVSIYAAKDLTSGDVTLYVSPNPITLSSGGSAFTDLGFRTGTLYENTYRVVVTAVSGSITHNVGIIVNVSYANCPPSGGSVAAGTLITLATGTQVPVQNLSVGAQLQSYNMSTNQFVNTTLTRFVTVVTNNSMVISTSTGKPLIVDQNPAQKLYAMFPNGTWTLLPVTELQVDYRLFNPLTQAWVPITNIHYESRGNHVMYDIYSTSPGNYIANGYLDPLKDGPH